MIISMGKVSSDSKKQKFI